MKYKKGDLVRVKSREWYDAHKDIDGYVDRFVPPMARFCGKIATVTTVSDDSYTLDLSDGWLFTDDMLEDMSSRQLYVIAILCTLMKLSEEDLRSLANLCTDQPDTDRFMDILKARLNGPFVDWFNTQLQN